MITFLCILWFIFVWIFFGTLARKMNDDYIESLSDPEDIMLSALTWVCGPISFTILFAKTVGEFIYGMFDV